MDYGIQTALNSTDIDEVEAQLDAGNGIIKTDTIDYVLRPIQPNGINLPKLPGEIRKIDFITPIKEKNFGEYMELPYRFYVTVSNPDVVMKKEFAIKEEVTSILTDFVANKIAAINNGEQLNPQQIQQELAVLPEQVEQLKTAWFDKRAADGFDTLEYINKLNSFEVERLQRFFYWWSTERFYTYRYIKDGELIEETISPTDGFPIENGEQFVEDYDGFLIVRDRSIDQIEDYYDHLLTDKDREYLEKIRDKVAAGENQVVVGVWSDIYGRRVFDEEGRVIPKNRRYQIVNNNNCVKEYILFFITYVKKTVLYYENVLGETNRRLVDEDYELRPDEGDVKLKDEWIREVWKQVRLGDKNIGIYLKPERIQVQRYNAHLKPKLPIGGKVGILTNNLINPVPKRILPSMALYMVINLHIERQMAKYKGAIELIPQSLIQGKDDLETVDNMFFKIADNTIIYNDEEIDIQKVVQGYRVVGNDALTTYLRTLIDLREQVRMEAWDMANMNPSRYGVAPADMTVRGNEQNIYRGKLGSMLMIDIFNKTLARDHAANLEYAKYAYIDGKEFTVTDRNGVPKNVSIPTFGLLESDFGIFVEDSLDEDRKLREARQQALAAAQNGEVAMATELVYAENSANLKKTIDKLDKANKEFQIALERAKGEGTLQAAQVNAENDELNRQNELQKIQLKESLQKDREVTLKEMDNQSKEKINKDKTNVQQDANEVDRENVRAKNYATNVNAVVSRQKAKEKS